MVLGARWILLSVAAFVVGALGAFAIGGGLSDGAAAPATGDTTTTTTAAALPPGPASTYFVDPHETVVATSAIVPVGLEITDSAVNLEYEVVSLAPQGEEAAWQSAVDQTGFQGFGVHTPPVYAVDWKLTTTDGTEIETSITNVEVSIARFRTEAPLTHDDIERIEITRYLIATPLDIGVRLSEGLTVDLFPGVALTVVDRTDLDNQTAFEVSARSDVPIQARWIHIIGEGPDWDSSSRSNQGGGNWAISWNATDLPVEVPARVVGTAWLLEDEPLEVSLDGVR